MARIRSVHPSLFTDEAWVTCSPLARLLYIGLWTDADDQGLFEWKPLQIKMRLLPGDDAAVADLLAELVAVDLIASLESGGKKLGAIRYFRRFQRPKKPNKVFLLPAEWVNYVGLGAPGSEPGEDEDEPVPNQFPTEGEKSPQMEDGGWRREVNPQKPPMGAFSPEFLLAWSAYPEEGRATTSQTESFEAWKPLAEEIGAVPLLACVKAFAVSAAVVGPKAKAAPKFAVWLRKRRFETFLAVAGAVVMDGAWPGPPDVWAAICASPLGESWARSYLAKCEARGRTLFTASKTIEAGLRRDAGKLLDELGVEIVAGTPPASQARAA